MSDVFSKRKRSQIMSVIQGTGNRSTEGRIRYRLVAAGFSGWLLHDKRVAGKPDFTFPKEKVAIFVDGCFWHGCHSCRNIPSANRSFWRRKIFSNRTRDQKVSVTLRKSGWKPLRLWEHEVRRSPEKCLKKIESLLKVVHA